MSGELERVWYVYLARCRDDSLYCGICVDPEKRVEAHNAGKGSKYIRSRGPAVLVWVSATAYAYREALRVEARIKRLPKHEKERICRLGTIV